MEENNPCGLLLYHKNNCVIYVNADYINYIYTFCEAALVAHALCMAGLLTNRLCPTYQVLRTSFSGATSEALIVTYRRVRVRV